MIGWTAREKTPMLNKTKLTMVHIKDRKINKLLKGRGMLPILTSKAMCPILWYFGKSCLHKQAKLRRCQLGPCVTCPHPQKTNKTMQQTKTTLNTGLCVKMVMH